MPVFKLKQAPDLICLKNALHKIILILQILCLDVVVKKNKFKYRNSNFPNFIEKLHCN